MRKLFLFLLINFSLVMVGCEHLMDTHPESNYKIKVERNGIAQSGATVMFVLNGGMDTSIISNEQGEASLITSASVDIIAGMKPGLSGVKNLRAGELNATISLEDVDTTKNLGDVTGTFGVYSTDANGDVVFKYKGIFLNHYCVSWLAPLGTGNNSNNPNSWDVHSPFGNFTAPWKGHRLLVPRRYQTWFKNVYGYSISQGLFLRANY